MKNLLRLTRAAGRRTIHLVDLENLIGSSAMDSEVVARLRVRYNAVSGLTSSDLIVLATGSSAAPAAWYSWGGARRLVRRGVNGADEALLDVIEDEELASRFARVVIASGDGIFAEACATLAERGVWVTIVGNRRSISHRLRLAVRDVRHLDDGPSDPAPSAELEGAA